MTKLEAPSANLCLQILLLKGGMKAGPLRFISSNDARNFQSLSRSISRSPESASSIIFTTGLGLTANQIPLRLPALLVPTLQVLERLHAIGIIPPKYIVYQATEFISGINDIDYEVAQKNAFFCKEFLQRYVHALHPSIEPYVHFSFAEEACATSESIRIVMNEIHARIKLCSETEHAIRKISQYRCHNERDEDTEFSYAAANILYNGAISNYYPFRKSLDPTIKTIIPVGGKREEPFFQLTKLFNRGESIQTIPLLQRPGEMPTYYPYKSGDILTPNSCTPDSVSRLSGPLKYDFDVLESDGADTALLGEMYSSVQSGI